MSELNGIIEENLALCIGIIIIVVFMLLILMFMQLFKLNKLRRRYEMMMKGDGVENLESLLIDLKMQLDSVEDDHKQQQEMLDTTVKRLNSVKGHVGLIRYNAFAERGSDLSFSVAIMNDQSDGIVLTSIYNRENSYIYAKSFEQGESKHALSTEEKEAIALARQKM